MTKKALVLGAGCIGTPYMGFGDGPPYMSGCCDEDTYTGSEDGGATCAYG